MMIGYNMYIYIYVHIVYVCVEYNCTYNISGSISGSISGAFMFNDHDSFTMWTAATGHASWAVCSDVCSAIRCR